MSLKLKGYIELPANLKEGGFDHAAVHTGINRLYVAHTLAFDARQNKVYAFLPQTHQAAVFVDETL